MAQRLIEFAREFGEHLRWTWRDPPNTGGAVPAC
jgi:hypothetical protein